MNHLIIQVLALIFLFFSISRVWLGFKNRNLTISSTFFWNAIWIAAIIAALNPEITTQIAKSLGIGRGSDAVVYVSIALLFYLTFRTQVMMEDLRHEITRLVREIALHQAENQPKSHPKKS